MHDISYLAARLDRPWHPHMGWESGACLQAGNDDLLARGWTHGRADPRPDDDGNKCSWSLGYFLHPSGVGRTIGSLWGSLMDRVGSSFWCKALLNPYLIDDAIPLQLYRSCRSKINSS